MAGGKPVKKAKMVTKKKIKGVQKKAKSTKVKIARMVTKKKK